MPKVFRRDLVHRDGVLPVVSRCAGKNVRPRQEVGSLDVVSSPCPRMTQVGEDGEASAETVSDPAIEHEDLDAAILTAEALVKKAKSKVAEAEMFVMRNRY